MVEVLKSTIANIFKIEIKLLKLGWVIAMMKDEK